jgi:hypothetical protein
MTWNKDGKLLSIWVHTNKNTNLDNLSNEEIRQKVKAHLEKFFKSEIVMYTVKDA